MRIAYIGDFINHGKSLRTSGTAIVILLSMMSEVESIDVYCPVKNEKNEDFVVPSKVNIIPTYDYNSPLSILNLIKVSESRYDLIIFNILPTAFGNRNLSNVIGLLIPLVMKRIMGLRQIRVIYHNSVFTNDVIALGYTSTIDRFRLFGLGILERLIFTNIDTYVLLTIYKERISKRIGDNRINLLSGKYLEAVATTYMNESASHSHFLLPDKNDLPMVLMHGSWGPQKNLELGLETLRKVKESGLKFNLVISGGLNYHFEGYEREFKKTIEKFSEIVDLYTGPVKEVEIMNLFQRTNLLLLPYNAPGGHSGVLQLAMFFDVPTIAINFPEFAEESHGESMVSLVTVDNFYTAVVNVLKRGYGNKLKTDYSKKIKSAVENLRKVLNGAELH